jgi:hypothetical protein
VATGEVVDDHRRKNQQNHHNNDIGHKKKHHKQIDHNKKDERNNKQRPRVGRIPVEGRVDKTLMDPYDNSILKRNWNDRSASEKITKPKVPEAMSKTIPTLHSKVTFTLSAWLGPCLQD